MKGFLRAYGVDLMTLNAQYNNLISDLDTIRVALDSDEESGGVNLLDMW